MPNHVHHVHEPLPYDSILGRHFMLALLNFAFQLKTISVKAINVWKHWV